MANEEHVALLKQGVAAWNEWRRKNSNIIPNIFPDLSEANLGDMNLSEADLHGANLDGANLSRTQLGEANLWMANLSRAQLVGANLNGANLGWVLLGGANLDGAKLVGAKLVGANLWAANFVGANLSGANLAGANLAATVFGDVDLTGVIGLETCEHGGPSIIDYRTLARSGPLPLSFLRGVGLPDNFIEYLTSLLNQPIQYYSCFISYSTKDQEFADRLYADLQNNGVRCWLARHDMPIGAKIIDAIDDAIRQRDKVLLILSERAIASDWVEGEVTKALAEERTRKQVVLFPLRIDDAVMQTSEAWARLLRDQRNIGDFTRWKDHDAYKRSFERVVRDLTKLAT